MFVKFKGENHLSKYVRENHLCLNLFLASNKLLLVLHPKVSLHLLSLVTDTSAPKPDCKEALLLALCLCTGAASTLLAGLLPHADD